MSAASFAIIGLLVFINTFLWLTYRRLDKVPVPQVITTKEESAKESHPCEVRHCLISIDTRPMKSADGQAMTILLRRCSKCNEHFTTLFAGDWTLQHFLRDRSEIAELEGMIK